MPRLWASHVEVCFRDQFRGGYPRLEGGTIKQITRIDLSDPICVFCLGNDQLPDKYDAMSPGAWTEYLKQLSEMFALMC